MKRMNRNIIYTCLLTGVFMASCKKQLDIPSRNSVDAAVALTNKNGMEAAINSTYAALKNLRLYGRDLFAVSEAMSDLTFANSRSSRLINENRNQSGANMANWATSYNAINEININLATIGSIPDASADDKKRWEGELKFLRALYYFDLVKNYAYIPTFVVASQDRGGVVITPQGFNSAVDAAAYKPSRASISETYAYIMNDIYSSMSLLSNANRGKNYASKHAALALGSRVALYEGKWSRADSFATAAITLTGGIGSLTTTANYVAGWRAADHPEGIFQVAFTTLSESNGQNEAMSATHTTLSAPGAYDKPRSGQGDLVPNAYLLGELGITGHDFAAGLSSSTPKTLTYSNDVRNKLFEWGVNASGHYVEVTKWIGKNGNSHLDNIVVFRWAELYLNRAEARYRAGNEDGAWADLNVIRTARITGFTAPATRNLTGQALLDEILRQRMLELAFEGHRFYDLKRYGVTIIKTNPVVTLPATDFKLLPRIPTTEVDGNTNMKQNFNY